jgi:hypothetical protein
MWALIKSLLAKWAILRLLLKSLGSLAWLIPIAFLLKAIGIPLLVLLGVLGLPLLILLVVIGLPFFLVFIVGGALLGFTFWVLSMGLAILKIALPIILVVWLVRWAFRRSNGTPRADTPPDAPPATD